MEKLKGKKIKKSVDKVESEEVVDKKKKAVVTKQVKGKKVAKGLVEKDASTQKYSKVRKRKIKPFILNDNEVDLDIVEKQLDKEIEAEDNLSIGVMILILIGCLALGVSVGYLLYRLAINSSAGIIVINKWL